MTSPTLVSDPIPDPKPDSSPVPHPDSLPDTPRTPQALTPPTPRPKLALPLLLFCITIFSTTSVGMRYMYNFQRGHAPLTSDADVLPFDWMFTHLHQFSSGLPFSLTLIAILLAHEFGHYFACRAFKVRATLPYLLPAPSLSGSFGAVIRLQSRVRTRSALLVIGAMGPLAGFAVAIVTVTLGLHLSTYAEQPVLQRVQAPLLIAGLQTLLTHLQPTPHPLRLLIPHPVLVASWMGLLITALNLIPAGQLDGGHIVYAFSPRAHRVASRFTIAALFLLGIYCWIGWILWGFILMTPGMRHPKVADTTPAKPWHYALAPACLALLLLSGTYRPFQGFSLLDILHKLPHRY